MHLMTIADYLGRAKILYHGTDVHLPKKWDWWCEQLGPDRRFVDVTAEEVDECISKLMSSTKRTYRRGIGVVVGSKQMAPGTVNKYIAGLGQAYKLLKLHRLLPRSFTSPIVRGMLLPLYNARTLQVSLEDVHRLVAAARGSQNRRLAALIAVACTTGLRRGNIVGLRWKDVDLERRTIDVARTKNGTPMRSVMPLWVSAELTVIAPATPDPEAPVFGTSDFKRAWASTVKRAGLPETWTFHSCRHIAASILAQSGASLPTIMSVLNHKTASMGLRYTHLNTRSIDEAMTKAWS